MGIDNYSVDYEKIFYLYFLKNPKYLQKIYEGFFSNPDIDILARVSRDFLKKFGDPPTKDQIKFLVKNIKEKRELDDSIVEAIFETDIREFDEEWLLRTSEAWIKWKHFDKKLISTIEFIKLQEINPENIEKVVNQAISMIGEGTLTFDIDTGLDFFDPENHTLITAQKIDSGKDFVNRITGGGYDPKTLVVYAGEQNVGKCLLGSTIIRIRNKKTGEIEQIFISSLIDKTLTGV